MKALPPPSPPSPRAVVPLLLRVRTTSSFWCSLRSWLQQWWQHFCTPRVTIQPPLQPKRQKPFPQRPHHRRRQAVFAALATAAPDATIAALINHVRAVTGTGCSRKLILAWRQARGKDTANERHGDAATVPARNVTRRRRVVQLRLFLWCVFVGATMKPWLPATSVTAQEIVIAPAPSVAPSSTPSPAPRLLRIQLTLQAPHELRIKVGDEVQAGEVLSDQRQARQRLLMQKRALQAVTQHLQTQRQLAAQSLQQLNSLGFTLPPTTFATEQAAIVRAEAEAVAIARQVELQKQKLSVVSSLLSATSEKADDHWPPATDHQSLLLAHETAQLTQAQQRHTLAQSELAFQRAKLTSAQEARVFAIQQQRVERTRQLLALRAQQQQTEIERARLTAQLIELDLQLAHMTVVRAPFAGTIKRIEWEEMKDETLTVLVYLAVAR